jgi:hypothetical protein
MSNKPMSVQKNLAEKSASRVLGNGKQEIHQELLRKVIDFDIKLSELCKRK